MRKLRFTIIGAVVAGLAAAALSAPASASPPVALSGTFTQNTFNETFVKEDGGNIYYSSDDIHTYTGTLTGTDVFVGTVVVHKDGTVEWHGTSTFTGTVAGSGVGTVVFEVNGGANASLTDSHCHQQQVGGTLAVHASLDLVGDLNTSLTYSGTYHS
jgi:hypothetical protein